VSNEAPTSVEKYQEPCLNNQTESNATSLTNQVFMPINVKLNTNASLPPFVH